MNEQKKQILQMLADGKITVDDAERLLTALDNGEPGNPESVSGEPKDDKKLKFLHIKMESQSDHFGEKDNIDIKIPILLLKAGIKLGTLMPERVRTKLNSRLNEKGLNIDLNRISPEHIDTIITVLKESTIDIDSEGDKIKIYCA
jgi:hypothetical protein